MSRARSVADLGNQNVLDLNASEGTLKVGAGVTIENTGEVQFAGIVTAATVQVGAATTLHSTGLDLGSGTLTCHNITSTGLLTYEDVTSVDSIGIITARSGIDVGTGTSISSPSSNVLTLGTAGSERLRIDSSSTISIGNLVSPASANIHLDLYCNSSYDAFIRFRDESGAPGLIGFDHGSNAMQFYTNGASPAMSIDSSDRMLLGLTSARATKAAASIPSFQIEGTVDSDSRMNIGRNSNSDNGPEIHLYKSRGTTLGSNTIVQDDDQLGSLLFIGADGSDLYSRGAEISAFVDGTPGNDDMPSRLVFSTCASGSAAATERMRIDSNGKLVVTDIGSTAFLSAANSYAQAMISSNVGGLIINSTDTTASSYCRLIFTPNGNLAGNEGLIRYNTNDFHMSFWTQANERMRIDSSGNVEVKGGAEIRAYRSDNTRYGKFYTDGFATILEANPSPGDPLRLATADRLEFYAGSTEKMRLDSSGRLLVGSISAGTLAGGVESHTAGVVGTTTTLDLASGAPGFRSQLSGNNNADQVVGVWFNHGGLNAGIGASRQVTNQWGTDLRFYTHKSTVADQNEVYERLRIYPDGGMRHGAMISNTTHGAGEYFSSGGFISIQNLTFSTSAHCFQVKTGIPTMTTRMVIRNDGDLENANNSYTAYSDASMKENIVDANSQWGDIKALRVRNYNFKEETGHSTHRQIGVIAQELETTSPGLVSDSFVSDDDGNPTDETYKTVNYSVLYMKAVKALQEAMERIETLEASNTDLLARVTALEAQ